MTTSKITKTNWAFVSFSRGWTCDILVDDVRYTANLRKSYSKWTLTIGTKSWVLSVDVSGEKAIMLAKKKAATHIRQWSKSKSFTSTPSKKGSQRKYQRGDDSMLLWVGRLITLNPGEGKGEVQLQVCGLDVNTVWARPVDDILFTRGIPLAAQALLSMYIKGQMSMRSKDG